MDQLEAVQKQPRLEGRTSKIRRRRKLRKEEEKEEEKRRRKHQGPKPQTGQAEFLVRGPSESAVETWLRKSIKL